MKSTPKEAADIAGGVRRFFKPNPYANHSYEDLKNVPQLTLARGTPDDLAFFKKVLTKHIKADPSRPLDYTSHLLAETEQQGARFEAVKKEVEDAVARRNLEAQQAAQQAHIDASNTKMRNIGQDALIASGGLGVGLYGGKKVYDTLREKGAAARLDPEALLRQRGDAAREQFDLHMSKHVPWEDAYSATDHLNTARKFFHSSYQHEPELKPSLDALASQVNAKQEAALRDTYARYGAIDNKARFRAHLATPLEDTANAVGAHMDVSKQLMLKPGAFDHNDLDTVKAYADYQHEAYRKFYHLDTEERALTGDMHPDVVAHNRERYAKDPYWQTRNLNDPFPPPPLEEHVAPTTPIVSKASPHVPEAHTPKKFPWGKLGIGAGIAAGTAGLAYGGKKLYDHYKQANTPSPTEAALFLKDAIKKLTLFHPEKLTSPRDLDSLGAHVREYVAALPPDVKAQINHLHGDFEAGHATAHDILKGNIPAPPIKAAPTPQPQQPKQHNDASSSSTSSDAAPSKSKWPLYTALGVGGAGLLGGAGAVGHHLYKEREAENMLKSAGPMDFPSLADSAEELMAHPDFNPQLDADIRALYSKALSHKFVPNDSIQQGLNTLYAKHGLGGGRDARYHNSHHPNVILAQSHHQDNYSAANLANAKAESAKATALMPEMLKNVSDITKARQAGTVDQLPNTFLNNAAKVHEKAKADVASLKERGAANTARGEELSQKSDAAFKSMEQQEASKSQSLDQMISEFDNLSRRLSATNAPKPKAPMSRAGKAGLIGAGIAGAGLGGYGLYKALKKESEEQSLTEEQMQTLRLMSLTPEQRAMYMQVNPAGVPKMATHLSQKSDAAFKSMEQQEASKSQSLDQMISEFDNLSRRLSATNAPKPKAPMSRAGKAGLIGAGIAGAGLGGYGLYKALKKESEEQSLTEEQMQTLRLMSLTPEQRAMYMQVNPAGVPKMATHKEAGVRDFVSRHLGRKSEEFIQGRKALDVAAKAKNEEDLLAAYAKKRGLHVDDKGVIGTPPPPKEPGFLQRNKLPLGLAAAGAGGLYMMNQQDKMGAYNETLCRLGLAKLAAKMPPPIPLKAKGPAASKGKPFFTPSQATAAKKMEGPAPAKAPWEEKTSAFNQGYVNTLSILKLAGKAEILVRKARNLASKAERTSGTQTAQAVQSTNPAVGKMQSYLSGGAVGVKPTPKANMQSYVGASLRQPTAAPAPAAKPSASAADKMRAYNKPAPQAPPSIMGQAGANMQRPEGLLGNVKQTQKAPLLNRAKGQWDQMGNLGKGMLAGGAGLGLLGGGMGLGAAMSPDVVVH
jgi:mevalonate kinase